MVFIFLACLGARILFQTSIGKHVPVLVVAAVGDVALVVIVIVLAWSGDVDVLGFLFFSLAFFCLTGAIVESLARFHIKKKEAVSDSGHAQ